jgi:NAD(P)-dependent dehydrogenase (short-subunit alcohol dehydrogenase family)
VRSNCISPAARTRLTEATPGLGEIVKPPDDADTFDVWDPANVSPLVAYLATADCPITGRTFFAQGGTVRVLEPWHLGERLERDERWTIDGLAAELPKILS